MEAWVYATDFPAADANAIISRRSHVTGKGYLFGVTTGGAPPGWRVMFLADDFPQAEQAGRLVVGEHEDLEDDRWYHVAVTFEHLAGPPSSRRVALFLDGHLVAVAPDFPQELSEWQPNAATWIGGDDINANDDQPHRRYSYNFAGRIADVRVTTGIRYPLDPGCEQVGQAPCCQDCFGDQLQACLASDDDVIAYWPLNEGDGCTVHDLGPDGLLNSEDPPALNAVVGANPDACADRWLQGQEHACSQRLPPAGDGG